MPPDAEPRQVSTPAAARPGATTVGVVIRWFVEFVTGGSLILTDDDAPDVLPKLWAYTGVVMVNASNTIHERMVGNSRNDRYEYFEVQKYSHFINVSKC
jgi:hypothetical protein